MKSKVANDVIEKILRNTRMGIKESADQERSPIGRIKLSPEFIRQETLDFPLKRYMNLEKDILGTYTPMTSPGIITLRSHELNAYFFHLLNYLQSDLNLYIIEKDLKQLITLIVFKTYHHEFFHFFCDVQRQLFPTLSSDHLQEEALAVAYSALRIDEQREPGNWQTPIGRMSGFLFNSCFKWMFQYTSPGYRDWRNYYGEVQFKEGLKDYIDSPNFATLRSNRVDIATLLYGQLNELYRTGERSGVLEEYV